MTIQKSISFNLLHQQNRMTYSNSVKNFKKTNQNKKTSRKKWKSRSLNLSLLRFVFSVEKQSTNSLSWGSTHDYTQRVCFTNWAKVAFACVFKFSISCHHNKTPKNTTTTTPPQTTTKTSPQHHHKKDHNTHTTTTKTARHHKTPQKDTTTPPQTHNTTTKAPPQKHKKTTPQFSTIVSPPVKRL